MQEYTLEVVEISKEKSPFSSASWRTEDPDRNRNASWDARITRIKAEGGFPITLSDENYSEINLGGRVSFHLDFPFGHKDIPHIGDKLKITLEKL